ICRDLAGKDIGQTIIVKEGAIIAVEAVEGTDETIDRGGRLAGSGVVMVKMSRPKQDMRYDIPTIGMETINRLADMKAAGLAFEAGRVVIVNKDEVIERANSSGIALVAV
ncbi:MAG: LpxI family protein, partial [Nitrospinota bacterium]|nr:LpxI family protein [Nitrospinota bacterium]